MAEMGRGRRAERVEPANAESGPESWPTARLPLSELRAFVRDVLVAMAENRDIMTDDRGRPRARLRDAGENSRCSFYFLVVDMSAIGMPIDTPLNVSSHEGDTFVTWYLGRTPLAHTPKGLTAKEAANSMSMDVLLAAHRRFVRVGRKV